MCRQECAWQAQIARRWAAMGKWGNCAHQRGRDEEDEGNGDASGLGGDLAEDALATVQLSADCSHKPAGREAHGRAQSQWRHRHPRSSILPGSAGGHAARLSHHQAGSGGRLPGHWRVQLAHASSAPTRAWRGGR